MLAPALGGKTCGLVLGAAALAALAATGCASAGADTEREMDALRKEVVSLRAQAAALSDRLDAIENRSLAPAAAAAAEAPASKAPGADADRPELAVVRLSPTAEPQELGATDSRVKIRSTAAGNVVEEPVKTDEREAAAAADFRRAKELFDRRSTDKALAAFGEFIVKYPDHPKLALATHHRGLCYAQKGDTRRAAEQFEAVAAIGGQTDLTADALLELTKARDKLGEPKLAELARERLKSEFPKSAAAKRLQR